jgi:hypothetical protein
MSTLSMRAELEASLGANREREILPEAEIIILSDDHMIFHPIGVDYAFAQLKYMQND